MLDEAAPEDPDDPGGCLVADWWECLPDSLTL